jgi:hypothetical protein
MKLKATMITLTAALGLTMSAFSAKANTGMLYQGGYPACRWVTSARYIGHGFYRHYITFTSLRSIVCLRHIVCNGSELEGWANLGYGERGTFFYDDTHAAANWRDMGFSS